MSTQRIFLEAAVAGFTYQFFHSILLVGTVFLLVHVSVDFVHSAEE